MTNVEDTFVWGVIVDTLYEVKGSYSASLTVYWGLFFVSVLIIMDGLFRGYRTPPKRSASGPSLSPFSTSPHQLQEVTSSANATLFDQTKISPMRGRSVKEYDEQLTALKKENFNLKLRIYFLEERMGSTFRIEDKENILRKNIEYQVDLETLRKELDEKQDLLCQAVKALELEDTEHKKILSNKDVFISELNEKIESLEHELKSVINTNTELTERNEKLIEDSTQIYNDAFGLQTDNTNSNEEINQLKAQLAELNLQNSAEDTDENKNSDESKLDMTTLEWAKQVEDLMEVIQEKEDELQQYREKCDKTTSFLEERDNRIVELEKEVTDLKVELDAANKKINEFKTEKPDKSVSWIRVTEEKDKKIEQLECEVRKHTFNLQGIVNNELWDKNREIEKLQNRFTEKLKQKEQEVSELEKQITSKNMQLTTLKEKISELGIQINLPSSLFASKFSSVDTETPEEHSVLKEQLKVSKEECKYLHSAVEELRQQLRNTPERDGENKCIQLKEELIRLQQDYDKSEKMRLETVNLCSLLTTRLEELAHFLDSLLKHKSVLGMLGSKQRSAIKQAIDQSLDLSKSLSVSMMNEDQSLAQLSSLTGLLNTSSNSVNVSLFESWRDDESRCNESLTYNSHLSRQRGDGLHNNLVVEQAEIISILRAQIETMKKEIELRDMEICKQNVDKNLSSDVYQTSLKNDKELVEAIIDLQNKECKSQNLVQEKVYSTLIANKSCPILKSLSGDNQSESEAWSEPDRCVSQARMGLDSEALKSTSTASLNRSRSNKSASINEGTSGSTEDDIPIIKTPSKRGSGSVESRHTVALLQENLSILENKLKEKENEILSLKTAVLELDNKSLELKLNMAEEIAKLRNEKMDVEQLLKDTEEKIKDVHGHNDEILIKIAGLEAERDQAIEEAIKTISQVQVLKIKTTDLENLLRENESEHENKLKEIDENWKSRVQKVEQDAEIKIKEILDATNTLKKQYEEEWIKKSEMNNEVTKMVEDLVKLKETLISSETKNVNLEKIVHELKNKYLESEELHREKLVSLKRELNESTLCASQAALERTKISNEKLKLESEIRKLESRETVKCNEFEEKEREFINMKNTLQQQIAVVEQQKSCLQLKVSELESTNAELHNRLIKLQTFDNVWGKPSTCIPKITELVSNFKAYGKHSLGPQIMRQKSDMSGYASEDVLIDENDVSLFNRSVPPGFHWFNQAVVNIVPQDAVDARNVANSSPDLGIESDQGRFSSLETNVTTTRPLLQTLELTASMNNLLSNDRIDTAGHYCNIPVHKIMEKENIDLKKTVSKLEEGLEKTMSELSKINKTKKQVEKGICKQIHKTSLVLRQARANLDSGSENENKRK